MIRLGNALIHRLLSLPLMLPYLFDTGANTQVLDGLFKDNFEDYVSEMVNNKLPLKSLFKTTDVPYGGRETIYDAHVGRNTSPMFTGEDSAMADPGAQKHVQVRVGQKKIMGRVRLTAEVMLDTSKGEYAWKQARKDEMDSLINDIARREEIAMNGYGAGILAFVNAGSPSGSATLALDSPNGIAGADFGNRFIIPGMFVGFVDPATGNLRSGVRQVVSVSQDGTSITLDSAPGGTVADNDYVVQAANSAVTDILDTGYERDYWGILALVDDGTFRTDYFGVDRDIYDAYNSYVSPSTGALSADAMQSAADVTDQKLNGITDLLIMQHTMRRVHINDLSADRRYIQQSLQKPDPGTAAFTQGDLTMGEVPIKAIRDFSFNMVIGLDSKNMKGVCYESEPGKWVDEDGRVLIRAGTGSSARDAFEAWYRRRMQYHLRNPGVCWRLDGLTGGTVIVVRPAGG